MQRKAADRLTGASFALNGCDPITRFLRAEVCSDRATDVSVQMSGKERDATSSVSIAYPAARHIAVTAQCRIEAMQSSAAALECRVAPNQGHGNRAAGTGKDVLWTAFAACLPSSEGIDVDAMLPSMVCIAVCDMALSVGR